MLSLLCSLALAQEAPPELPRQITLLAPIGTPQFVFQRPVLGATHLTLQLGGIALAALNTRNMVLADEQERYDAAITWRFVSAGAVATVAVSYFVSVMVGSRDYQLREALLSSGPSPEQRALAASSWQQSRRYADTLVFP